MREIQQNARNNDINSSASKNNSYQPDHFLERLVTVPVMNMVTKNSQFTMVGLPPSMLQRNSVCVCVTGHQSVSFVQIMR